MIKIYTQDGIENIASLMKPEIERIGNIEMTEIQYNLLKNYIRSFSIYGKEYLENKSFDISEGRLYDGELKAILDETISTLLFEDHFANDYYYPDL